MLVNLTLAAAAGGAANPVSIDWWTLVLQSLNLLIVMGGLYILLFKPIAGIMKRREETVEGQLAHAASAKEEADKLLADYKAQLQEAKAEAREIVEKAVKDAEEYGRRMRVEADQEAQAILAKAKQDIQRERELAVAAIRDEVATLAVAAASKVLGRAIAKEDHEALVNDFVNKAGELN